MILNTNISALNNLRITNTLSEKSSGVLEKLSSGLKINRAADDAAGVAISGKMRGQIRGLEQAGRNIQDGISFVQVADGSLGTVHDILQRGKELCVQAANDTNTQQDRVQLNQELEKLCQEIDKIGTDAEFNTLQIFANGGAPILFSQTQSFAARAAGGSSVTFDKALTRNQEILAMAADVWVPSALKAIYSTFSNLVTVDDPEELRITVTSMGNTKGGSLRPAFPSTGGGAVLFELKINKDLINTTVDGFDNSGGLRGGGLLVDQLIAHEMTHAVMADNMERANYEALPGWFSEGMCEAISGGFQLRMANVSNEDLQKKLNNNNKDTFSMYYSGYAAVMYIGFLAGGSHIGRITEGIGLVLDKLKAGETFDQALQNTIGFTKANFMNHFKNDSAVIGFLEDLRQTVGNGSGSILKTGGGPLKASLQNTINDVLDPSISSNHFVVSTPLPGRVTSISTQGSTAPVPPSGSPGGSSGGSVITPSASGGLIIQLGANGNQNLTVDRFAMSAADLGVPSVGSLDTRESYNDAIQSYDDAIGLVSNMRSYYGATQNRLEFALENANIAAVNTQASDSRIRDANISNLMLEFTKTNILTQSATAMLAQANQMPQSILSILR
jgi:flagellin